MAKSQIIGERVLDNYDFLKKVARCRSEKKRMDLLHNATSNELLALIEISSNILKGNFCLTSKQKKRISPYASYLRELSRIRSEKGAKRFVRNQKGGQAVLGALLAPILVEAAHHLISKIAGDGEKVNSTTDGSV